MKLELQLLGLQERGAGKKSEGKKNAGAKCGNKSEGKKSAGIEKIKISARNRILCASQIILNSCFTFEQYNFKLV